jgi:2-polyprenyl-3-methyl-5-hydroxy-6-metoxy-1,4-benzoquinol methylase
MSEFDNRAGDWDKNQIHVKRSEAIAAALLNRLPITDKMTALEYGAGTGLLSFILKDRLAEITLMDNSQEMIKVSQSKIAESGNKKMKALWIDLEKEDYKGQFDIIYNQMVLHHVGNIDLILSKFHELIKPDGYLAIADLYKEDGSFHGDAFTGHKRFDVDQLTQKLEKLDFKNIVVKPCYSIQRENEKGEINDYPIFLLTATKKKKL